MPLAAGMPVARVAPCSGSQAVSGHTLGAEAAAAARIRSGSRAAEDNDRTSGAEAPRAGAGHSPAGNPVPAEGWVVVGEEGVVAEEAQAARRVVEPEQAGTAVAAAEQRVRHREPRPPLAG